MRATNCRPTFGPPPPPAVDPVSVASIYTPGDVTGPARPWAAGTPYTGALNVDAGAPVHVPVIGVLVAVAAVLLLERRRLKLGGK